MPPPSLARTLGAPRAGLALLLALFVGFVPVASAPGSSSSLSPPSGGQTEAAVAALTGGPAAVRAYWTPARMRAAQPIGPLALRRPAQVASAADGVGPSRRSHTRTEVTDTHTYPARVHGKVFVTFVDILLGPADFVCSGTAIHARGPSVVLSTGHCVFDWDYCLTGCWGTNWMFVPGYRNGNEPFERWVAGSLAAAPAWVDEVDARYDVGAARMLPNGGATLESTVGSRGIAFDQARQQAYSAFGYPAEPPPTEFDGEHLFRCDSRWRGDDSTFGTPRPMRIDCDLTGGASGGGWVIQDALVASVTSYGYIGETDSLYGPYFGAAARGVYGAAARETPRCLGAPFTQLGTRRGDRLHGAGGADISVLEEGPDEIASRDGADRGCGGAGHDVLRGGGGPDMLAGEAAGDRLSGGRGRDQLSGGSGSDLLLGGPGSDVCRGGPGDDVARSCEETVGL